MPTTVLHVSVIKIRLCFFNTLFRDTYRFALSQTASNKVIGPKGNNRIKATKISQIRLA